MYWRRSSGAVAGVGGTAICNPVGGIQYDHFENIAPSRQGKTINRMRSEDELRGVYMTAAEIDESALRYGSMALVTDHADVNQSFTKAK